MVVEAISKYLLQRNITSLQLAQKSNLELKLLEKMLQEKRPMGIDEYIKICDALEVPYNYFFYSPQETS